MSYEITFMPYGTHAILMSWPSKIDQEILEDIQQFVAKLKGVQEIKDVIVAYHTVTLLYKHECRFTKEKNRLVSLYQENDTSLRNQTKCWEIPVCYHEDLGLDLIALAQEKKMSTDALIALHSSTLYTVHFIGFMPGFMYLGGLDERLITPRKAEPRIRVPKGSVAIGGQQTGVYPMDSAGGWHIIGNSPIAFFSSQTSPPSFASAGDKVRFVPISLADYKAYASDELPKFIWL